tara:strand:- start:2510 stop:3175 length:666 start_codon:yes stop_codon:yes gene_type:complete
MTLDEIAYNLLNLMRGGRSSNDEHISLEQIKFNIKHYRAMFIRRDYAKNQHVSTSLEQDIGCVPLIKIDGSKCCNLPTDCPVFRTERKLPKTVRFNFKDAFTFIGKPNGTGTIPKIEPYEVEYLQYDKFTKNQTKYYLIDDHVYVYNPNGLDAINIRGVFEDPEDVHEWDTCNGNCYDNQTDYPLPLDMLSAINTGLLQGELAILMNSPNDGELDRQQNKQ